MKFSVCIPNFNYAKYLGETISSVLDQSFSDFEIIVADNASTDDSIKVVESFKSPKIRLIKNRYNIGFAPNLDRATEDARGEHMILLSSDDLMKKDALGAYAEVLRSLGDKRRNSVLTSAFDVIDGKGELKEVMYRPKGQLFYQSTPAHALAGVEEHRRFEEFTGLEALRETLRAKNSPAAFVATCYSRELYERVEGYHNTYRIFPDGHFLNKLLAEDPVFVYVPERLFAYRVHSSNQTALEASQGALKYQVDAYMHTVEFPDDVLKKIGVSRQELVDVFVERALIDRGLQALVAGHPLKAFRCLAFGLAAYPKETIREPKSYGLAALLGLGPAAKPVSRALFKAYDAARERRKKR